MNDQEFLAAFESCTLPPDQFNHRAHIRMAWLVLCCDGWETGFQNIRAGIQRFANFNGASTKYHETITRFWALLVNHAITLDPHKTDFESFLTAYPHLLDARLVARHFSREALANEFARRIWIEPDLELLPVDMVR